MRDSQDGKGSISFRTFAALVAFILAIAILTWGPWNTTHVASNPGPKRTPGSTTQTPPPAAGPSETNHRNGALIAGLSSVTHHSACCEPFQQVVAFNGLAPRHRVSPSRAGWHIAGRGIGWRPLDCSPRGSRARAMLTRQVSCEFETVPSLHSNLAGAASATGGGFSSAAACWDAGGLRCGLLKGSAASA